MGKTKESVSSKGMSYRATLRRFVAGESRLSLGKKIGVVLLLAVISGFIGWLWEFGLQEVSGGFGALYIKGGNFLPWISLYAIGAVVGLAVSYPIRRYPWLVFVVAGLTMGAVELLAGVITGALYDGARYWDYSDKWWGFGNIDGLVCPVSATVFGIGILILVYVIVPLCIMLAERMSKRSFLILVTALVVLVMVDEITNLILKNLGLSGAPEFYHTLGWSYKDWL